MKKLVAAILSLCLMLSCVSVAGAEATGYTDVLDLNLMVAAKSNHGDWNEFWVLDTIEKYCGIRFHVTQVSEDGWQEKKNLAFAIIHFQNFNSHRISWFYFGGQVNISIVTVFILR